MSLCEIRKVKNKLTQRRYLTRVNWSNFVRSLVNFRKFGILSSSNNRGGEQMPEVFPFKFRSHVTDKVIYLLIPRMQLISKAEFNGNPLSPTSKGLVYFSRCVISKSFLSCLQQFKDIPGGRLCLWRNRGASARFNQIIQSILGMHSGTVDFCADISILFRGDSGY